MQDYDYIFAGAGCASLSLACALQHTHLRDKKILLIDQDAKRQNDRTWCYWTATPSVYDAIAQKAWHHIHVQTHDTNLRLDITPYRYQMIRGADFYAWARALLAQNPNVDWVQAHISHIENTTQGAIVHADKPYKGQWIFNSLPAPLPMLVEFTVFGRQVMPESAYLPTLVAYIQNTWGLQAVEYEITEEEFGVIPMSTQTFPKKQGSFVINIGSAGGATKASTGFTFQNIQKHTQKLLASLCTHGHPLDVAPRPFQFQLYDHVLLNVLDRNRLQGSQIFETLFKKHPVSRILRFLDDETTFWEDLKIMYSVPSLPFLKAVREIFSS